MDQDATCYGSRPRNIVLDGDPAPPKRKHSSPPLFSQMAEWIKMPLGMEIGLGPGRIVLDGDPASPKKGTQQSLQFSAMSDDSKDNKTSALTCCGVKVQQVFWLPACSASSSALSSFPIMISSDFNESICTAFMKYGSIRDRPKTGFKFSAKNEISSKNTWQ